MSTLDDLPLERAEVITIQPGDSIVIRSSTDLTGVQVDRIRHAAKQVWPDNQCIVLTPTLELTVVRPEQQIVEEIAAMLEREARAYDDLAPDYPAAGVLHEAARLVRERATVVVENDGE